MLYKKFDEDPAWASIKYTPMRKEYFKMVTRWTCCLKRKQYSIRFICVRFISANTPTVNTVLQMTAISHLPFHYNKSIECVSVRMFKSSVPPWFANAVASQVVSTQTGRETHHVSGINACTKRKTKQKIFLMIYLKMSTFLLRMYALFYLLSFV